jgi:hypothetical protein
MNDKNIQTRNRMKADRDPLKGAPGHQEMPVKPEVTKVHKATEEAVAQENQEAATSTVDQVLEQLGAAFGEDNVQKFRDMLSSKAADAEHKFMDKIRSLMSGLPKDFSLPNFSSITSRPGTSAAVATGVGALFLLREYLTRDTSAPKAPKKKVAGSERNPSSARVMSAAKGGKSKAKASKAKPKPAKGAKAAKAKPGKKR